MATTATTASRAASTGYSTNETDEAVQASIVAAGHGATAELHPCPTDGTACRIMPLGDSITDGVSVSGGHRVELFRLAGAADQKSITFVGSGSRRVAD